MTAIEGVTYFLEQLSDEWPLAKQWIHNDIIKKSIAITYDDWIVEMEQLGEDEPTLEDHIIYYLDTRDETFFNMKEPTV
ncbi:hypothetical protein [Sporosarcina sp. E16_8]|uniref:hypothetical protein n=1 Tax=Sporosarcina sp. E16_8 TaxID=2789295 RepID=UPI001A927E05|nr:hypothetical protein [Sporosarcina sp. E16_8]MBO0586104.1 hypothetical protein [Sporosarcina sp. E16_8]